MSSQNLICVTNLICNFCNCQCFLLICVFRPTQEFFHSYGDVTINIEGLKFGPMLGTHGNLLSSEGSLMWYTYCDTGHPFNNGHLRGPMTLTHIAEGLAVELSLPVFKT